MKVTSHIFTCSIFLFVWPSSIHGIHRKVGHEDVGCRYITSAANQNQRLGINRVSSSEGIPLFLLELAQTGSHEEYRVWVKLGSHHISFSDAVISLETNGSCGVGELHYDKADFYRVDQDRRDCPLLLATNRKVLMQQLPPLRWKIPKCGCVTIRSMIIEGTQTYYKELLDVSEGPLATVVCVDSPIAVSKQLSREQRVDLLCRLMERVSGDELLQSSEVMESHQMSQHADKSRIELALNARHNDLIYCCAKNGHLRDECLADIRRRRVDSFCEDGFPDIPFTEKCASFMRERERACCWRLGESRYHCFAQYAEIKHGSPTWTAEYSLDASDPVNDLADYKQEILNLEREDQQTNRETTTTPATTTTTPETTTTIDRLALLLAWPAVDTNGGASSLPARRRHSHERRELTSRGVARSKEVVATDIPSKVDPPYISRELDEQQGGRSFDRTFAALQRRLRKLSLKTRCCEGGAETANNVYGDFSLVWGQCSHGASKHSQSIQTRDERKMCSSQFLRCCMEIAISAPASVVTLRPDDATSIEWDKDRDVEHKLYSPPHARSQHVQTALSSRNLDILPAPRNSAERRGYQPQPSGSVSPRTDADERDGLSLPSYVDPPEIDEEPVNNKRRLQPVPKKEVIHRTPSRTRHENTKKDDEPVSRMTPSSRLRNTHRTVKESAQVASEFDEEDDEIDEEDVRAALQQEREKRRRHRSHEHRTSLAAEVDDSTFQNSPESDLGSEENLNRVGLVPSAETNHDEDNDQNEKGKSQESKTSAENSEKDSDMKEDSAVKVIRSSSESREQGRINTEVSTADNMMNTFTITQAPTSQSFVKATTQTREEAEDNYYRAQTRHQSSVSVINPLSGASYVDRRHHAKQDGGSSHRRPIYSRRNGDRRKLRNLQPGRQKNMRSSEAVEED